MNDKELALKIIELTGSKENISSVRHCATRLRLVVKNKDKINVKAIESLDKVKGSFFNSGQYQIILGTGLVNRVYDEVIKVTGEEGNNNDEKIVYGNKFQRAICTNYSCTCRNRFIHGSKRLIDSRSCLASLWFNN